MKTLHVCSGAGLHSLARSLARLLLLLLLTTLGLLLLLLAVRLGLSLDRGGATLGV